MTERLTKRNSDGSVGINDLRYYNYDDFQKMAKKLAHYEDLEEQGRLHIVPKEFWDKVMKSLAEDVCPFDYGLVGVNEADCKVDDVRCKECWEKALKGE